MTKVMLRVETDEETFVYEATAEEVDTNLQNTYSQDLAGEPWHALYVPLSARKVGTRLTLDMRLPTDEKLTSEKK